MMKRLLGSWIFIAFMLCIDFYVFQALRLVTANLSLKPKWIIYGFYWSFTVMALILFFVLPNIKYEILPAPIKQYLIPILIGFFIAKLVAAIFLFLDDLRRILYWLGIKLASSFTNKVTYPTEGITRSVFLSWIGIGFGGSIFGTLLYGFGNKYKYRIEKIKIKFENLPLAFKGLKIIHISDIHSGSLDDKKAVEKGIQQIIDQNPDLILFTGDLVNNEASEMEGLKDIFSRLKAPLGVYSILGNHDYGDYKQWPSKEDKVENLNRLKSTHMEMGWRLLLNEHVVLEKENDTLALVYILVPLR